MRDALAKLSDDYFAFQKVAEKLRDGAVPDAALPALLIRIDRFAQAIRRDADAIREAAGKPRGKGQPRAVPSPASVKKLHDEGASVADLARRFRCSRASIYRALERAGSGERQQSAV